VSAPHRLDIGSRRARHQFFDGLLRRLAVFENGTLILSLRYPALDPIRSDPRDADLMR